MLICTLLCHIYNISSIPYPLPLNNCSSSQGYLSACAWECPFRQLKALTLSPGQHFPHTKLTHTHTQRLTKSVHLHSFLAHVDVWNSLPLKKTLSFGFIPLCLPHSECFSTQIGKAFAIFETMLRAHLGPHVGVILLGILGHHNNKLQRVGTRLYFVYFSSKNIWQFCDFSRPRDCRPWEFSEL